MSLEGIRAWIGEIERKLRARTKVFLALAVIAIGIAGAGIYLSIDTRSDAVSEADVQELQRELEVRMGGAVGVESPEVSALQAEIEALRDEVEQLQNDGKKGNGGGTPTPLPTIPDLPE